MRLQIGAIGVLLLLSLSAQASTIEDETTKLHDDAVYQEDAGIPGDAPDLCADLDASRVIDGSNDEIAALIVEGDDESDVFHDDTSDEIGGLVSIEIIESVELDVQTLGVDVLSADCSYSVLDPNAPPYQSIAPQPGAGEKLAFATLDKKCSSSKNYWKFHISGERPLEIFIEWTNGEYETLSYIDSNNGAGNYITTSNTDYTVRVAEAVVPSDWNGQFSLKQRPCNAKDGGADPVERFAPAPTQDGQWVQWAARADSYVVHVFLLEGFSAGEGGSHSSSELNAVVPSGLMDKHCHRDACTAMIDYNIRS